MMIDRKSTFLALVFMLLAGCSAFQVHTETTGEKIAAAQATLTGVYQSIADLVEAGALSESQRVSYLAGADEAHDGLSMARMYLRDGFPEDAIARLQFVNNILLDLQGELGEVRQ